MNNLTTFYIVRHGESVGNAKNNLLSPEETTHEFGTPLSELGKQQAKLIAKNFKDIHFDAVFSSDLIRATETAEIIVHGRDLTIQTTKQLRERDYGSIDGKVSDEVKQRVVELTKHMTDEERMKYKYVPDMESNEEAAERMIIFLREAAIKYPGRTILVTNHGNLMRSLLTSIGWAAYDEVPGKSIANTGYIVLESDGTNFFVKETNGIQKMKGVRRPF